LAAIVSGTLVAFNAFTLTRLPQIQDLHLEFFLPALYALDRVLNGARQRDAVTLAFWFVLQALTGLYLMVFTFLSLLVATLARPTDWRGTRFRALVKPMLVATAIAIGALIPFMLPYYHASATVGLGRSLEETARYSAKWTDYLAAPGRIYFDWWGKRFFQGDALFPGITALLLAIVGIAAVGWKDHRARMTIAFGLAAFALSFGPAFPPYRWLYRVFPLLTGIRGAVRFGEIVLIAIGILAGFGVAALQRRLPVRWATTIGVAVFLTANAEALRAPLFYSEYHGIPAVYDALDHVGRKAILAWFPFYDSTQFHQNAPFMLVSTRTFNPMLNGYSGFKPASYYKNVEELAAFPDDRSITHLQRLGVSVVLVDGRNMRPANLARIPEFPQLSKIADEGNLRIYLLSPSP
jgi:MFS family permease